ncbi:ComF family protein [Winogradskyella eximia]|jgi:ComF family protein|uniref:ComF family protein n=1 Tax=Winogradskyella eximia TaxID=262006 RepID=A0A3D9HAZ0_9FLAO|nr:ComF family protein [Winogradskyella eximia]RED46652.1 ComF family protein [Winogradskyella eximia]|tara:strand:- start:802 stop:1479 length:678 start_codon:yes stop_codon:yes gene_type:complete
MKNLLNLFFPKVCEACNNVLSDNEVVLCTSCRHHLPVTNFHFDNAEDVKKVLYGRVKLENASALLHFSKKGIVQQILHNLKYRGHEDIGAFFGEWFGAELATLDHYKNIDVVLPVPLYKSKLRKRGYNQVTKFGEAIAKALNADYNDAVLIKTKSTKTQVFKGRLKRWNDDGALFDISENKSLVGKHILLVDDIITTGATVEACATVLLKIDNIKLSLATMAIAD